MQEQNHFNEEQLFAGKAKVSGESYLFQEVDYPPPLWKRVVLILLLLILGFAFGAVVVMSLFFKTIPVQSNPVYILLVIVSIPCMVYRKTRFFGFGLLAGLIVMSVMLEFIKFIFF